MGSVHFLRQQHARIAQVILLEEIVFPCERSTEAADLNFVGRSPSGRAIRCKSSPSAPGFSLLSLTHPGRISTPCTFTCSSPLAAAGDRPASISRLVSPQAVCHIFATRRRLGLSTGHRANVQPTVYQQLCNPLLPSRGRLCEIWTDGWPPRGRCVVVKVTLSACPRSACRPSQSPASL